MVISIVEADDKQVGIWLVYCWFFGDVFNGFLLFTWGHNPEPGAHISYNTSPDCFNGVLLVYIVSEIVMGYTGKRQYENCSEKADCERSRIKFMLA